MFSGAGSGAIMGENTNGQGGFDSCDTSQHGGLEVNIYNAAGMLIDARFTFVIP